MFSGIFNGEQLAHLMYLHFYTMAEVLKCQWDNLKTELQCLFCIFYV